MPELLSAAVHGNFGDCLPLCGVDCGIVRSQWIGAWACRLSVCGWKHPDSGTRGWRISTEQSPRTSGWVCPWSSGFAAGDCSSPYGRADIVTPDTRLHFSSLSACISASRLMSACNLACLSPPRVASCFASRLDLHLGLLLSACIPHRVLLRVSSLSACISRLASRLTSLGFVSLGFASGQRTWVPANTLTRHRTIQSPSRCRPLDADPSRWRFGPLGSGPCEIISSSPVYTVLFIIVALDR